MTEESNKEENKLPENKLYAESRGKYTAAINNRFYFFEFPGDVNLSQNAEALKYILSEVEKAIDIQIKKALEAQIKKETSSEDKTEE